MILECKDQNLHGVCSTTAFSEAARLRTKTKLIYNKSYTPK